MDGNKQWQKTVIVDTLFPTKKSQQKRGGGGGIITILSSPDTHGRKTDTNRSYRNYSHHHLSLLQSSLLLRVKSLLCFCLIWSVDTVDSTILKIYPKQSAQWPDLQYSEWYKEMYGRRGKMFHPDNVFITEWTVRRRMKKKQVGMKTNPSLFVSRVQLFFCVILVEIALFKACLSFSLYPSMTDSLSVSLSFLLLLISWDKPVGKPLEGRRTQEAWLFSCFPLWLYYSKGKMKRKKEKSAGGLLLFNGYLLLILRPVFYASLSLSVLCPIDNEMK